MYFQIPTKEPGTITIVKNCCIIRTKWARRTLSSIVSGSTSGHTSPRDASRATKMEKEASMQCTEMSSRRSSQKRRRLSIWEKTCNNNSRNIKASVTQTPLKTEYLSSTRIGKISRPTRPLFGVNSGTLEMPTADGCEDRCRRKTKSKDKERRRHISKPSKTCFLMWRREILASWSIWDKWKRKNRRRSWKGLRDKRKRRRKKKRWRWLSKSWRRKGLEKLNNTTKDRMNRLTLQRPQSPTSKPKPKPNTMKRMRFNYLSFIAKSVKNSSKARTNWEITKNQSSINRWSKTLKGKFCSRNKSYKKHKSKRWRNSKKQWSNNRLSNSSNINRQKRKRSRHQKRRKTKRRKISKRKKSSLKRKK